MKSKIFIVGVLFTLGCGGSAEDGIGRGGAGGGGGSGPGVGGGGGTGGGSQGSGGSAGGSIGTGGGSQGSGGGSQGTGGSGPNLPPGFEDCRKTCQTIDDEECPGSTFDIQDCLGQCDELGTRGSACDRAFAEAYACFVEKLPVECDSNGDFTVVCGPCDDELSAVAENCDESEIRCTF